MSYNVCLYITREFRSHPNFVFEKRKKYLISNLDFIGFCVKDLTIKSIVLIKRPTLVTL